MYECNKCHKQFTRKINLQYHIDHNVCEKKTKITLKIKNNNNHINYEGMTKQELLSEINQLKGENRALKENPKTINNQINIMVPPAFLTIDNYQQITKQLPNILHNTLVKHPANFISYLIKETNCNPNLPMYNSIKIISIKTMVDNVSITYVITKLFSSNCQITS